MYTIQQSASQVVRQVLAGKNLNQALSVLLSPSVGKNGLRITSQQRGALQDMSYGTLRFYGQLVCVLDQLLHKPVQDVQVRCLLLVALYQLLHTKASPHAVVDHAVRAVRKCNAAASGLTNAVLRNFLRNRDALLTQASISEEGRYAYPQWWIDAVRHQYGVHAEGILLAGNLHPPMTLRVNSRRNSPEDYRVILARHDIESSLIKPGAVLLAEPVPVMKLPGFFEGLVSVQDAGAQYAAHLMDVKDGMRVLDACAAPGGKSTHILELAQVDLLALDKNAGRLELIGENLQRLKLHAKLQSGDASQPDGWWDGKPFQRILADVPCSASGVVRRHPDIKWLRRSDDIKGFARQQLSILRALWSMLEDGGKLLYATCSIFSIENQNVINEFLIQNADSRQLSIPAVHSNMGQLFPDDHHDGFFYALLQKNA